jgi:hypothetical protein
MSLRDYVIATRTITLRGEHKMSVRALGFDDIQHLLVNKQGLIDTALKLFGESGFNADSADPQQVREFGASLLATLPELAGELIALAADEADQAPKAMRLPAPTQLEALMSVYELTFTEPDSVKNFFGRLAHLMTSVPRPGKAVSGMSPPQDGSNGSGATLNS